MFPTGLLTPEAVAGLALLAFLPRAKGQPVEDQLEVGFGWLVWTLGFLVTGVAVVWGWWFFGGFGTIADAVDSAGPAGESLEEQIPPEDTGVFLQRLRLVAIRMCRFLGQRHLM